MANGQTCPTCGNSIYSPFRIYDKHGKVVQGCVDESHTGHLVTPSESARFHNRPEAKKIRAQLAKGRSGKGYGKNPRIKQHMTDADVKKYWYGKGFDDALLKIRPRNRMKDYVRGYKDGKHYQATREKYGFNPDEKQIAATQQKRYAKRRKYTGATAPEPTKKNPPATMIYSNIESIHAQKGQQHICDAECKRVNHRYVHKFSSNAAIYGLPNGDVLITGRKR